MPTKKKVNKDFKPYRSRKKVVEELQAKGEITDMEAKQLNNAIKVANKEAIRGKYFIDLEKYVGAQKKELQEAIDKGRLTEAQKKMLHTLQIHQIEKPILNNSNSIAYAIDKYFAITLESANKPTMNGLALALGISKGDLLRKANGEKVYISGVALAGDDEIREAIQVIATNNELDIANSGGMGQIFLGKNHFGLTDKTEMTINHKEEDTTKEELDEKYKDIIDID